MKPTLLLITGILLGIIAAPVARATDQGAVVRALERIERAISRPIKVECICRN